MKSDRVVVIIVEDELLIRLMAADVFAEAGYLVLEADSADEALSVLEAEADNVDVLFTDVHMPGELDGLALAHHTMRRWPWIGQLITSGRAHPAVNSMPEGSRFLPKPYRTGEIIEHLQMLVPVG